MSRRHSLECVDQLDCIRGETTATAVGIGRPQVWGLAAFGQPGVESVVDILNREVANIMRQAGTPTIASITGEHVRRSGA